MKRMMLLSNSKNPGSEYLDHVVKEIERFVGNASNALFVPYAGVTLTWDDYTRTVQSFFAGLGIRVTGIHTLQNPVADLESYDLIIVGGGNTFNLLNTLYHTKLLEPIKRSIEAGNAVYIGWSAGSNVAGPTIKTTNDMPITEPPSFNALNLVPFHINPHYTDNTIPGHGGESRSQRLDEFIEINQGETVVCLPEGSWVKVEGETYTFSGQYAGLIRNHNSGTNVLEIGDVIRLE